MAKNKFSPNAVFMAIFLTVAFLGFVIFAIVGAVIKTHEVEGLIAACGGMLLMAGGSFTALVRGLQEARGER